MFSSQIVASSQSELPNGMKSSAMNHQDEHHADDD